MNAYMKKRAIPSQGGCSCQYLIIGNNQNCVQYAVESRRRLTFACQVFFKVLHYKQMLLFKNRMSVQMNTPHLKNALNANFNFVCFFPFCLCDLKYAT